ncbi:MAG: copper chaperone [Winogradskyella sp.]|uniref:heavy-metal-associated domain-containing protein n=1 Tax=Winogradskyella sp. TaxID=1883156 RepID=UPI000F40EEFC|nr:heavy-metal-associated domain-containing protein [Winogradskyella sp.]RNC87233.1 MAG: copper chaperone [Winogradskyella sp.]
MNTKVTIQNLKCSGCKNSIIKHIKKVNGISNIKIDIESSEVAFEYATESAHIELRKALSALGYPITGDPNTIMDKAKSYVQCAIGRLQ